MVSVRDVDTQKLINTLAEKLEKVGDFKQPEWASFVKTGTSKQRPPTQSNWWYLRAASIFRKIYLEPGIGVNNLRKVYGGRKNRGHKPEHKFPGSGKVIRTIMGQMQKAGYLDLQKNEKGKVLGRKLNKKGISLLNETAKTLTT